MELTVDEKKLLADTLNGLTGDVNGLTASIGELRQIASSLYHAGEKQKARVDELAQAVKRLDSAARNQSRALERMAQYTGTNWPDALNALKQVWESEGGE